MRIARFTLDQEPIYGVVEGEEGDEVVHAVGGDPLYTPITPTGKTYPIDQVRLLAPVIPRSKVIGVAHNYRVDSPPFTPPLWFGKPNTSVAGPWDAIALDASIGAPAYHEAELAIVISRLAKDVPREQADKVILGYTVANDIGYRDGQGSHQPGEFWSKYRDGFTPLGPWIETDLHLPTARVRCWVDGDRRQDGAVADLIEGIGQLVETASSVCTLLPGDVILTGTPAGAGPIEPGQRITCEVTGIGTLTNPVIRR